MTIMTAQRAMKLLLAAGALALLSGCIAVVDSGRRAHPHGSYHHGFYDDGPRRGHFAPGHRRHRHFGVHGGHRSPPGHQHHHRRRWR